MASIIMELYFLLEFRHMPLIIVGGGVVVLGTTYLLLDFIQEQLLLKKKEEEQEKIRVLDAMEILKDEIIEAQTSETKMVIKYHREDIKYMIVSIKEATDKLMEHLEELEKKAEVVDSVTTVGERVKDVEGALEGIGEVLKQDRYLLEKISKLQEENIALENEILNKKKEQNKKGNHQMSPEEIVELFTSTH